MFFIVSFFVSYSFVNFCISSSTSFAYFSRDFISSGDDIFERIGNILFGVFAKYTIVSENIWEYFVLNSSRVRSSSFSVSAMKASFSLYRSAESAIVPIKASHLLPPTSS